MKQGPKEKATKRNETDKDSLRTLKHDINNQLSNILLALEQLRYELTDASEDCTFYLDSISMSTAKINALIKGPE